MVWGEEKRKMLKQAEKMIDIKRCGEKKQKEKRKEGHSVTELLVSQALMGMSGETGT